MARSYVRIMLILIPVIAVSVFALLRESRASGERPRSVNDDSGAATICVSPSTQRDTVDQPGGSSSRAGVGGTVDFTVRDSDGNVREVGTVSAD